MSKSRSLSVDDVVSAIAHELSGAPPAGAEGAPATRVDLARVREAQRQFRADPVGGRLAPLKKIAYWLVASAFDRQGKVIEALLDELEAAEADRARLERQVARLEARSGSVEREKGEA
jgi:hypothetical protein